MNVQTKLKRGSFARDVRTGQVVRIKEQGGRDWMVRPAYKSEGYWVDRADLVPADNPHAWTGGSFFLLLLALAVSGWTAYSAFDTFTAHGLSNGDAFVYALPNGLLSWVILSYWTNLVRP